MPRSPAAYALPQLLATYCGEQMEELMRLTPWRKKATVTAGQVRLGLRLFFGNVRVRDWWNPTCRKFQPDYSPPTPGETASASPQAQAQRSKNKAAHPPPP